jgi:hypothetical protein
VTNNVSDIIQANRAPDPAYYGPGSTAGQFANLSYMYSKTTLEVDMSLNKDFKITERLRMGINFELYNALSHPFPPLAGTNAAATTFGTITSSTAGIHGNRTGQFRAYVSWYADWPRLTFCGSGRPLLRLGQPAPAPVP